MAKHQQGGKALGSSVGGPYVPVFVGSTFIDLKPYRSATEAALVQLETIVRGMEYFGSKPGTPVEECLRVVRSCKIYIGIFGMRYGSIPKGFDKSMTHLEYDEAQTAKLPSLIYIIDEENQPIIPKHIEFGTGAQRLVELKAELRNRHLVSSFTTPDDLRSRVLHNMQEILREIGQEISGELDVNFDQSDADLLRDFSLLPKVFAGRSLTVEFINNGSFRAAYAETSRALGLEIGATVFDKVGFADGSEQRIFAERDLALRLCKLPKGTVIQAQAVTVFGIYDRIDYIDEPVATPETETGLVLKKLLNIAEPKC